LVALLRAASAAPAPHPATGRLHRAGRDLRLPESSSMEPSQAAPPEAAASHSKEAANSGQAEDEDAEILRIEKELDRIHHDPVARRAFYRQIEETVECVRKGKVIPRRLMVESLYPDRAQAANPRLASVAIPSISAAQTQPSRLQPSSSLIATANGFHSILPEPTSLRANPIRHRLAGRASAETEFSNSLPPILSPAGDGTLNSQVVAHLLYWARQNNCPPELALATAWQESRMTLNPADGSSGEIGILQILPARAKAEGVNPKSLRNPDVNMWLGTKLLAQYYREEGTISGAAMKYVAGPNLFNHRYPPSVRDYIAWYSGSVRSYARYFKQYVNF
jgi:soluble lytic murein transglycosylase-like protein